MQNALLEYFSSISNLTHEELSAIEQSMEIITFSKGSFLLREGEIADNCYFILKGCARQFFMKDGEEITSHFYTENNWMVSMESFSSGIPSSVNWIAVEDTEVVIGSSEKEKRLFADYPHFENTARLVIEKMLAEQQQKIHIFMTQTPEERYLHLLKSNHGLLQRVSQYHIASYIGVKPESLSRIKKRILMNEI